MFSFFAPAYIKEAHLVLKNARKLLDYKRDLLPASSRRAFEEGIARLETAIKARERAEVEAAAQHIDQQWSQYLPPAADAAWRENCEVFLVAIVVAIGVRTFFLQPFTIPTGSMEPTLNGIKGYPTDAPAPNLLVQAFDFVMRGRNYVNVIAKSDDVVVSMDERKMLIFFTLTDVQCEHSSYNIWAPKETLQRSFHLNIGSEFHAGEALAHGYVEAGDHVFVDKVSYNLHSPARGEVFVFNTRGIPRIENQLIEQGIQGSEFYIKRLTGLPLDTLRIASPLLYVNGREAQEFGPQRVMGMSDGYGGYSNPSPDQALYLTEPDATYTVPASRYFAMGDNSYNSFDSRYWGGVPQDNLMGRGLFVYWPFLPHWGFVR
jgi:signal peptidase I